MSKIMSVLEKLNVVEKVNDEKVINEVSEENDSQIAVSVEDKHIEDKDEISDINSTETHKEAIIPETQKKSSYNRDKFEKNLSIEEIYTNYNVENDNINTVFMLENFLNALPENLPSDVKKSTVLNIVNATKGDLNKLISDGTNRVNVLESFTNEYSNSIEISVSQYKSEIDKLKKMILSYEEQIHNKEILLKEQNHIVKYEIQRISNIISAFKND